MKSHRLLIVRVGGRGCSPVIIVPSGVVRDFADIVLGAADAIHRTYSLPEGGMSQKNYLRIELHYIRILERVWRSSIIKVHSKPPGL